MTKIYDLNNHILIHTGYTDPMEHRHMAAHMIISINGEIQITSETKEYLCKGIIIPSGVSHRIETYGNPVLVFLYDSTTNVAKQIQNVQPIHDENCTDIVSYFAEFEKDSNRQSYGKLEECVLKQLHVEKTISSITDERIVSAIKYIQTRKIEKITCKEVANIVFLSEGRFSHLFKAQVGMTFAAYLIYQRIVSVYTGVIQGKTITEAAIEAGFSSSSHFSDVNRRVFGLPVSDIAKNFKYIKIT